MDAVPVMVDSMSWSSPGPPPSSSACTGYPLLTYTLPESWIRYKRMR